MDEALLTQFIESLIRDGFSQRGASLRAGKYARLLEDWKAGVHKPSLRVFCEVLKANGYRLELHRA